MNTQEAEAAGLVMQQQRGLAATTLWRELARPKGVRRRADLAVREAEETHGVALSSPEHFLQASHQHQFVQTSPYRSSIQDYLGLH